MSHKFTYHLSNITTTNSCGSFFCISQLYKVPLIISFASLISCKDTNSTATQTASTVFKKPVCSSVEKPFEHTLCSVPTKTLNDNDKVSLELFWKDISNQEQLYTFENLQKNLKNRKLLFAVNAGMYNEKFAPIGYTVINNKQILSLNLNEGAGNFHLMPNGVFWKEGNSNTFHITESHAFEEILKKGVTPNFASQSGPLLVINNEIHPQFNKTSSSKKIRNGVGICDDGSVKFVNSQTPINFYEFADLYKTTYKCKNALFLDGGIASALYAPEINEHDKKSMGVMIALMEQE